MNGQSLLKELGTIVVVLAGVGIFYLGVALAISIFTGMSLGSAFPIAVISGFLLLMARLVTAVHLSK